MSSGRDEGNVLVLFALEREAAPFRRAARGLKHVRIHVSGIGRQRARSAAERILCEGPVPQLVIAAGFCGALVQGLRVGDVVTSPRIVTVDRLVSDPAEKRRVGEERNADAVDMESAAIEDVCFNADVSFLAVRAVSDTVDTALSPALVGLLAGGNVSPWKAAAALVKQPSLLGEFRRLARDTKLAARKLAEALADIVTRQPRHSPASSTRP